MVTALSWINKAKTKDQLILIFWNSLWIITSSRDLFEKWFHVITVITLITGLTTASWKIHVEYVIEEYTQNAPTIICYSDRWTHPPPFHLFLRGSSTLPPGSSTRIILFSNVYHRDALRTPLISVIRQAWGPATHLGTDVNLNSHSTWYFIICYGSHWSSQWLFLAPLNQDKASPITFFPLKVDLETWGIVLLPPFPKVSYTYKRPFYYWI